MYWDQQGRRNYGEILQDHDQFLDIWSIGPEQDLSTTLNSFRDIIIAIAVLCTCVYVWSPEDHKKWAEKDYPFNGLIAELGGDPENAAPVYKI